MTYVTTEPETLNKSEDTEIISESTDSSTSVNYSESKETSHHYYDVLNGNYEGGWLDGEPHGHGKVTRWNGVTYESDWEHGRATGNVIINLAVHDLSQEECQRLLSRYYEVVYGKNSNVRMNDLDKETQRLLREVSDRNARFDRYEGNWDGSFCNGYGKAWYMDGDIYEGEWVANYEHGHGKLTEKDGTIIEGEWEYGTLKKGKEVCPDGSTYIGGFYRKYHDGYGVEDLAVTQFTDDEIQKLEKLDQDLEGIPNREKYWEKLSPETQRRILEIRKRKAQYDRYEGEWKSGNRHGHGKAVYFNGEIYDGEWLKNQRNGHGRFQKTDGTVIESEWELDQIKFGVNGRIEYPDGNIFEGMLDGEYPGGYGALKCSNGNTYEGDFLSGSLPTGYYTIHYTNGNEYHGMVFRGMPAGDDGVIKYVNGDVYHGEVRPDGKAEGKGILKYANGDEYEGEFINGKPCGEGIITYKDGTIAYGYYENDMFIKEFEI
ncbi:MAG: hypothetical protein IKG47_04455 [Oscillospiraceae bacterium]|nr:hypothetical protein [Oscillospiraceae bacterium]